MDLILKGHEPNPALALDRIGVYRGKPRRRVFFCKTSAPRCCSARQCFAFESAPEGFDRKSVNFAEWRGHLLERLRRQIEITADAILIELEKELKSYPSPKEIRRNGKVDSSKIAVPIRIKTDEGELSFISTTTVFGTPVDITLSELVIESFFPADEKTASFLKG